MTAGYQPQTCSDFPHLHPPRFPSTSPHPSKRAPSFPFPFTVGHLTSPPSAFCCLYTVPFLSSATLKKHRPRCPMNSSAMRRRGKPTATKPPAADRFPPLQSVVLWVSHHTFQVFKACGVGWGGGRMCQRHPYGHQKRWPPASDHSYTCIPSDVALISKLVPSAQVDLLL